MPQRRLLIGRGTYEVAKRMPPAGKDYGEGWPGSVFVLTHRPPEPLRIPREVGTCAWYTISLDDQRGARG